MSHHHKKNQWLTKISPQSKFFTYLYTTTKFFHSHAKRKNSYMTKIKIPTSTSTNKLLHSQNHNHTNFPIINITYPTKIFHNQNFIPTKFCHVYKTKFTYTNKLFPHTPWTYSYKSNPKFSQCQYSQSPNQNLSNNITIYLRCQNSKSHQHCPNCTITIKKRKIHYKNATKPTFPNITNPTMPPKFQNNQMKNISPWNFQWNMQQYFSKQRNQRKTHLGVYMTIWSMGPTVLKKSIIIMPLKCWIIFLNMRC